MWYGSSSHHNQLDMQLSTGFHHKQRCSNDPCEKTVTITQHLSLKLVSFYYQSRSQLYFRPLHNLTTSRQCHEIVQIQQNLEWEPNKILLQKRDIKFHDAVKLIWAHAVQFVNKKNLAHHLRGDGFVRLIHCEVQTKQDYSNQNCWIHIFVLDCCEHCVHILVNYTPYLDFGQRGLQ